MKGGVYRMLTLQPGGEGAARAFFREENTRAAL